MSHVAKLRFSWQEHAIGRPWACVTVRVEKRRLVVVPGSIGVLRSDALVMPVPEEIEVCDENGTASSPSGSSTS